MLKTYIKLGIPMLLTCIIASALLGGVYAITKDPILRQDEEARNRSLREVLPKATTFEDIAKDKANKATLAKALAAPGDNGLFRFAFRGKDADGQDVGWGILVAARGYGGYMEMAVGLDRTGKVVGVKIISNKETPGLGTKATANPDFIHRFYSLDAAKGADGAATVDTIQGATKSSRGIKHGVQAAMDVYAKVLMSLEGGSGK